MAARPPAVARVLERVIATSRAHEMFEPHDNVIAAVSGGPDSICMLLALRELRRLFRIDLEVFHFDHRLRDDSTEDARYVRRTAERLGLAFHLRVAETEPVRGESVEDWAHRARMWSLAELLRETGADRAAIAHTRDDQAETVLLAMIRGGGLDSAAGIRPAQGPFVRPLIDVTREEVLSFVRALHLRPRADPTNSDTRLLRNAVRLKVIPMLERSVDRDVRATLARTASLLREDAEELQRLAAEHVAELIEEIPDGVCVPAAGLVSLPRAIASRVSRAAIYRAGSLPSAESVDAVLDLASGRPGRKRDLVDGLTASRTKTDVVISTPGA
jgi:tRNA(Ile)-lysidine synthase